MKRTGRTAALVLLAAATAYALFFYRDLLLQQRVYVFRDQYTIILAIDHTVRRLSAFDWPPRSQVSRCSWPRCSS